jgi:hypothetical protein
VTAAAAQHGAANAAGVAAQVEQLFQQHGTRSFTTRMEGGKPQIVVVNKERQVVGMVPIRE